MDEAKEETIKKLLNRFKDDLILLDSLYQWASNPTSPSAIGKGCPPNHGLIKENMEGRYNLDSKKAEEIYSKLVKEIENVGIDFIKEHVDYKEVIQQIIIEKYGDVLIEKTLQRLNSASQEEKSIAWLYCKVRGDYDLFPGSDEYEYYYDAINKFITLFNVTFNLPIKSSDIINSLIKIGFINRLEWNRANCDKSTKDFIFPNYLEPIALEIDKYISLPELPDYKKYINALFDKKAVDTLYCIDDLLNKGYVSEIGKLHGKIVPHPYIIGTKTNCVAINPRIYESLKNYFFERKAEELKIGDKVKDALTQLSDKHYPMLSITEIDTEHFEASKLWLIESFEKSLAESEVLVVLTPWLTGKELNYLRDNYSKKFVIMLSTLVGIPDINKLYKEIFNHPINESDLNWMILDFSKDKIYEMVVNNKPVLFDELKELITTKSEKLESVKEAESQPPTSLITVKVEKKKKDFEEEIRKPEKPAKPEELGKNVQPLIESEKSIKKETIGVFLGNSNDEKICWKPGKLNNGHFIIVGGSGAGKTETIRCIAYELDKQEYPVLMVDFHGDMAFENSNITTYEIKEAGKYYFNPLELNSKFEEITPLRATSDFVDSLFINFPNFGIQQKNVLKEIIKINYQKAGITTDKKTWSKDLEFKEIESEIKNSEDTTTQSVKAYLNDIFDYGLFSGSEKISMDKILEGGITHLNLRPLPESLRFLYADLFLRKLYNSLQALGEIPRGDITDKERFRLFVIVDEAKLLVSEKQGIKAVLNKYATELRKFGVGLIMASQLISHFNEEILSNIALKFCMRAENKEQARKNDKFFGVGEKELLNLKQGEGILIIGEVKKKLEIVPTWKRR